MQRDRVYKAALDIKKSELALGLNSQGEFDQWVEANRPNAGNIIVKIFIHTRIIVTAAQLFPVVVAGLIREDSERGEDAKRLFLCDSLIMRIIERSTAQLLPVVLAILILI